jgi:hypothetical protein
MTDKASKRDKFSSTNIVRTEPVDLLDRQFIDKCEGIAEPWVRRFFYNKMN